MEFQEKFEINTENAVYFAENVDVLIIGGKKSSDDRKSQTERLFNSNFTGETLYFTTNKKQNEFSVSYWNEKGDEIIIAKDSLIIPGLRQFFKRYRFKKKDQAHTKNICVDITSMPHILIFNLFKIFIKEVNPRNLFATYTEPLAYNRIQKKRGASCIDDEDFDLYEDILGLNYGVEGFSKIRRLNNEDLLVASLGFERHRLLALFEKIEPKGGLIPIVGFPSFKPGWNITALNMNYKVIEDAMAEGYIETCESSSPFEMYSKLKIIYESNSSNYNLMIAPFGTRPNCLGITLFVLRHHGCQLVFDFPIEKEYRSHGSGKTHFFVLSSYLND